MDQGFISRTDSSLWNSLGTSERSLSGFLVRNVSVCTMTIDCGLPLVAITETLTVLHRLKHHTALAASSGCGLWRGCVDWREFVVCCVLVNLNACSLPMSKSEAAIHRSLTREVEFFQRKHTRFKELSHEVSERASPCLSPECFHA